MLLRRMVYNFMDEKRTLDINGLPLKEAAGNELLYDDFLVDIVLEDGADAKTAILIAAPLVLRISIDIYILAMNDPVL